ncbi:hybrid sensor histidine kinase/response regulator [Massilia eurypsychrophila]|jgi:PAS domain S-box-containing protein|uniref:histidine kinase n=1 Tax=Massilia eurypsychrophila TaxID=1485217 RepID=A0A2G8TFV8_9BURK|nr:PAS domain-containing sensor histidine kinase [Massilia eurypsychrophila]PIL44528.1 hybrid sensor histidine kinase/response regulator [Massilia eurypsychrophila]
MPSTSATPFHVATDRFRLFVDGVTDYAIYMLSPEGIVSSWNAGAQRFKGYAPDEIIGQHFSRFYTEKDLATGLPARALETACSQGKFEDEGWRVRKDGTSFWASVVIDPIYDGGGALLGFAKITRDITARKRAAEALHASEERFRLLVQGVTDYAIYMLSPEGLVTNWNAGARRIKGYEEAEVLDTHFSRFYVDEDVAAGAPMTALKRAVAEGRYESEGLRVRKDGSRFWAHVVIDPIHDELGTLLGFAKVTRDITERRQAAQELERANLALFQSQKLEAIGKLTGGVAHDFNNLLSVVVNGLGILQRRLVEPEDVRILDAMTRAAARGATLTQQLLAFARRQPLKQENLDLNEVIGSFEEVLRRAGKTSVDFTLDLAAQLPAVRIDAAQLEASLLNLIVNARDATADGGTICLRTAVADLAAGEVSTLPAGRYVIVEVADSGEGMSSETLARAVEPFFTTKPVGKGTGLGLSQAYGLAQQSKGDLVLRSVVGEGTQVAFYLPALGDGQPATAVASTAEKALVVDDQDDVREMAVALFGTLGYHVISARNGIEALEALKNDRQIDVLFSDVVMPGMSGISLARQARLLAPSLKIILASGYASDAAGDEKSAVDEFPLIAKPYTLAQILKELRAAP